MSVLKLVDHGATHVVHLILGITVLNDRTYNNEANSKVYLTFEFSSSSVDPSVHTILIPEHKIETFFDSFSYFCNRFGKRTK